MRWTGCGKVSRIKFTKSEVVVNVDAIAHPGPQIIGTWTRTSGNATITELTGGDNTNDEYPQAKITMSNKDTVISFSAVEETYTLTFNKGSATNLRVGGVTYSTYTYDYSWSDNITLDEDDATIYIYNSRTGTTTVVQAANGLWGNQVDAFIASINAGSRAAKDYTFTAQ